MLPVLSRLRLRFAGAVTASLPRGGRAWVRTLAVSSVPITLLWSSLGVIGCSGRSMLPTLASAGDVVLYEKLSVSDLPDFKLSRLPARLIRAALETGGVLRPVYPPVGGDVGEEEMNARRRNPYAHLRNAVVIALSTVPRNHLVIKRVIGTPYDTVCMRDGTDPQSLTHVHASGGTMLPRVHRDGEWNHIDDQFDTEWRGRMHSFPLLEKGFWLEGDNQTESLDSRYYGGVPSKNIYGRVVLRIWPPNRVGWIS